jgi:hypothetical protein
MKKTVKLHRETLRRLERSELAHPVGAVLTTQSPTACDLASGCFPSCQTLHICPG